MSALIDEIKAICARDIGAQRKVELIDEAIARELIAVGSDGVAQDLPGDVAPLPALAEGADAPAEG